MKNIKIKYSPNKIEAEKQILGIILIDNTFIKHIPVDFDDYFFSNIHRDIIKIMRALSMQKKPIDLNSVLGKVKRTQKLQYVGELATLINKCELKNFTPLLREIQEAYLHRKIINLGAEITEEAHKGNLDALEIIEGVVFPKTKELLRLCKKAAGRKRP